MKEKRKQFMCRSAAVILTVFLALCAFAPEAVPVFAKGVEPNVVIKEVTPKKPLKQGWQKKKGNWYYGDSDNTAHAGWLKYNNAWYYFAKDSGIMQTGWFYDNGNWYYSDNQGKMQTGWLMQDGKWYYLSSSGNMKTGWVKYYNRWYYMNPKSGIMCTGLIEDNGNRYFLNSSGAMQTGWVFLGKSWYYFAGNGMMQTGWLKYNDQWYYLDLHNGDMKTGWQTIDKIRYFFRPLGSMYTGWLQDGYTWYYFTLYGLSYTGLAPYGADYYYVKNGVYDPRYNGKAMMPGYSRQFQVVNGFVSGGTVPPSEALSKAARSILDSVGWDLYKAYRYCLLNWTTYTIGGEYGTAYYANYGFSAKTGNCYVMAAMFTTLAREMGYEAYQMSGYVAGVSPHSWVEIRNKNDGKFYVCDPDLESERGNPAYFFTYGTPGTWRYSDYYRMHN